MTDPWARPPGQGPSVPPQPSQGPPPGHAQGPPPSYPPPPPPNSPGGPPPNSPGEGSSAWAKVKDTLSDPLSIVLVVVIVVALVAAGVLAGELYARNRANAIVAGVVSCVVGDETSASFGAFPPFLVQHMSGHYTNMSVETAGNRIREAQGMKLTLNINDVRLEDTADSGGSIGSMNATISWTADGIRDTVQRAIPLFGPTVVSGVSTNPSDGTIELEGALSSVIARPQAVNGEVSLEVVRLTGLGLTLPRESVQPALDAFTSELTEGYPVDINVDRIEVTDDGVVAYFSSRNASIPKGQEAECFTEL